MIAVCLPAAVQAEVRSFDVPAQSASNGIREFARQAGIQITLAGRDGDGRTTNSVRGSLENTDGLNQLLADTGLSVRSFDGKVAILAASSAEVADLGRNHHRNRFAYRPPRTGIGDARRGRQHGSGPQGRQHHRL